MVTSAGFAIESIAASASLILVGVDREHDRFSLDLFGLSGFVILFMSDDDRSHR